ncbi:MULTISPECIES: TrkH family potassium uptake protein [Gracilibacillus]|uniref:TrkH family potassium uptake protein n=1 Tax=Gracilibacillus TaxID=74385 RepID=UPI0008253C4B|nr:MULTISPECIES: TrkH family potassium uptake protein [Gracilibacillus]
MRKLRNSSPPQIIIGAFLCMMLIGTLLLKLPIATTHSVSWIDTWFTVTSALTVTGLTVVDTAGTYTIFGEMVLAGLIQLGGLGIMTFAVVTILLLGKRIGLKERLVLQHSLNQDAMGGVIRLAKQLLVFSLIIELIAMLVLSIRWIPTLGWGKGIYYSFFHSISAFNNAGFALWSDNLMNYEVDPLVNIVISLLIITGGLGFTVLIDLLENRRWKKLSLHSKLMVLGTLITNMVAMLLIFLFEYNNPNSLAMLHSFGDKLWASYFQAITARTAGFNTMDIAGLEEPTLFLLLLLMFIGAGSASTGGGIKLTTFIVISFAVITFLKGKEEIVIGRRSISQFVILRSLAVTIMGIALLTIGIFSLLLTENQSFLSLVFEVISAFGTVGLSMGITGSLTLIGKITIILLMVFGKIGPLTLAFAIAKNTRAKIRYPNEEILTG